MLGLELFVAAGVATQSAAADPLIPARSGQLQCYTPDEARKTCHALAGYRLDGEGRYINRAEIPLTADGSVTMTTSTPVRIVSGAVCGTAQQSDIATAEVRASGARVLADRATPVLAQIAQAMAPMIGHEICTRYEQRGDSIVAEGSMDGTRLTDRDQRVIWVNPSDGYRVSR